MRAMAATSQGGSKVPELRQIPLRRPCSRQGCPTRRTAEMHALAEPLTDEAQPGVPGKKAENLRAAVSLYAAHRGFMRLHKTLRTSPAMAAGLSDKLRTLEELFERTSD